MCKALSRARLTRANETALSAAGFPPLHSPKKRGAEVRNSVCTDYDKVALDVKCVVDRGVDRRLKRLRIAFMFGSLAIACIKSTKPRDPHHVVLDVSGLPPGFRNRP
jgi:hypothetical protein